ncbi:MAG: hypothetical protein CMA44_00730 [Euryarchaeota archaeon]|nr:hypothetical protein [Euryarchaeota archaeon]
MRGVSLMFHTSPLAFLRLATLFHLEKELGVLTGGSNRVDLYPPASLHIEVLSAILRFCSKHRLGWHGTRTHRAVP